MSENSEVESVGESEGESAGESAVEAGALQGVAVNGSDGADSLIGQAGIPVERPGAGLTLEIAAEAGQTFVLNFDPSDARAVVDGDNLILVFEDGGKIVFLNLVELAQQEGGPSLLYGGEDLIALLSAQGIIPGVLDLFDLTEPQPGETITITAALGQRFMVNFDPALAQIQVVGDDLVLLFANGGQIVIQGLGGLAGDGAPVFVIAGDAIPGSALMDFALAASGPEAGPDAPATLETAAGGAAPDSGGVGLDESGPGDPVPGLAKEGVIPPTELAFRLIDPTVIDPIEEDTPPQADPVRTPADTGALPPALAAALAEAGLDGGGVSGGGASTGGAIFITGHDSEEHDNTDYMNAGLDFLAFGHKATGAEIAERGNFKVAFLNPNNDTSAIAAIAAGGWDVTFFDLDSDFSAAFDGGFDLIMVGSGDGDSAHRDALFAAASDFEDFINGGGGLYINTDESFGQTWYDFVPSFGTALNTTIFTSGVFTVTTEGFLIGLTDTIVDSDITHSFYTGVDISLFTIFEVTDESFGEDAGLPVAFGARGIGISEGEFVGGAGIALFKQLTVDGVIGDNDFFAFGEGAVDMGGLDAQTPLESLVFTLLSQPNYGTLILDPADGSPATVMAVGDTFTSADTVWWIATESQVASFLEANNLQSLPDATFDYSVTDEAGNTAEAPVVITIDDQPTANPNDPESNPLDTVVNEALGDGPGDTFIPVPVDGNVLDNDDFGGDGEGTPPIVDVTYDGALGAAVKVVGASSITFTASNWTLVITTSGASAGDYTFTQTDEFDHPVVQGANSVDGLFTYTIEDGNGDQDSSTLTIRIVDDAPTAVADTDKVFADGTTDGNLITGVDANDPDGSPDLSEADTLGADGAVVTGVEAGDTGGPAVGGLGGGGIVGALGTLTLQPGGDYVYDADPGVLGTDTFTYTITDGDGDTSSATLSIAVGGLIVGSNADDQGAENTPHTVPNLAGEDDGDILGGAGDDILIGDPGGASLQGKTANFILVLDSSGSMSSSISFDGGSISRNQALKNAANALLDNLAASGAENIRVHLIEFDRDANPLGAGTFDIVVGGLVDVAELAAAHTAIDSLDTDGTTNYEAGLQEAIGYITTGGADPIADADVNQLLFVSDGKPNRALDGDGTTTVKTVDTTEALQHLTGTGDGDTVSEITTIEGAGFTIEAVGINVGETALDILDQVEGEPAGDPGSHAADNITTAQQLNDVIGSLIATPVDSAVGEDVIIGGAGDDIIFGDVPNTDAIGGTSFGPAGTHDGEGYAVLLEQQGSESAVLAFLLDPTNDFENARSLNAPGDERGEADTIDGGAGDDVIFGQGGADLITGGTGADTLSGGDGADTFFYSTGDGGTLATADVISDFEDGIDFIDLSGTTATDIGDVTIDANGGNASISVGGEVLAVLTGIANTDLESSDFIF